MLLQIVYLNRHGQSVAFKMLSDCNPNPALGNIGSREECGGEGNCNPVASGGLHFAQPWFALSYECTLVECCYMEVLEEMLQQFIRSTVSLLPQISRKHGQVVLGSVCTMHT